MTNETMEFISWAGSSKNLLLSSLSSASLLEINQLQARSANIVTLAVLAYLTFALYKPTATRFYAAMAAFLCQAICYSPLYHSLTNVQYYSLFSLIYAVTALKTSRFHNVFSVKVSVACCIMAAFELTMATDRWINAGIETWTYRNYESVVVCIHLLILSAGCRWDVNAIRSYMGRLALRLRSLLHAASYNRCL